MMARVDGRGPGADTVAAAFGPNRGESVGVARMSAYELPIKITERNGKFSLALAVSDQVVVSRQLTRADLMQLQVMLRQVLGPEDEPFGDY